MHFVCAGLFMNKISIWCICENLMRSYLMLSRGNTNVTLCKINAIMFQLSMYVPVHFFISLYIYHCLSFVWRLDSDDPCSIARWVENVNSVLLPE